MRTRAQSIVVLITFQVVISLTITVAAEDPEEGENFIWADIGEKNESLLLTQSEQGDGKQNQLLKTVRIAEKIPSRIMDLDIITCITRLVTAF